MKGLFAWAGFPPRRVQYERPSALPARANQSEAIVELRPGRRCLLSTAPLRVWFYVGVVIAAISVLYALFIIRVLIFGIDTPGYASLLIAVLLMGAIQLLSLGIIGEYLGRLFLEVKGRPIYVVEGVYEDGTARRRSPDDMDLKEEDILGADIGRHWYYRSKAAALRRMVGGLAPRRILDIGAGLGSSRAICWPRPARNRHCASTSAT